MKAWKKILVAVAALSIIGTADVFAGSGVDMDYSPDQPEGYENLWNRISRKLGRGISNAAFGAFELPIRIVEVNFNEGGFAAWTFGLLSGVGYVVVREVVGVTEVATFLFPLPGCPNDPMGYGFTCLGMERWGYGPILMPEWVITPATNYYNLVFSKSAIQQ